MSSSPTKRRLLIGGGVLLCAGLITIVLARVAFTGFAVGFLLKHAGASETAFNVTRASPWKVVVQDAALRFKGQAFSAREVSFERRHWWMSSLGDVRVEQARLPLSVDALKAVSPTPATGNSPAATLPRKLPFESLSVDGQIVLQAGGLPDQTLTVKLTAQQENERNWTAQVHVDAPGFGLFVTGQYAADQQQLDFTATKLQLDVKPWQAFVQHVIPLPDTEGWEVEGRFNGKVAGTYAAGKFSAAGVVQLERGRVANAAKAITAEGIDFDLNVSDFGALRTTPSWLHIRQVATGPLVLRQIMAEFALQGLERVDVASMKFTALGGTVSTEPYTYQPDSGVLKAVLLVDGISVEEIMALTKDLPAKAKGRVNGRFPISLDEDGFHFGTGWLELKPGVNAEVAFSASGLLTAGTSPKSPSYGVLQRIESGLLTLGISELRLDIQPPDAPAGRSATLHLAGAPLDPTVKAPVILDLNVNGPLEKLLQLGLDSRLKVGSKP